MVVPIAVIIGGTKIMECAIMEEGTDGNGNRDDTSVIMMGIEEREENMMKSRDH